MNLTKTQVESAKNVVCEKCNCEILRQVVVLKHISGLLMTDGKEAFIPVPALACNSCGHINKLFAKELGLRDEEIVIVAS